MIVLRYLGVSNYELAYKDTVLLLDAAIDKLAWWAPNGVTPEEMTKRVHGIFIGHAHGEHLWDAPDIAEKPARSSSAIPFRRDGSGAPASCPSTDRAPSQATAVKRSGSRASRWKRCSAITTSFPSDYMAKDRAAAAAVTLRGPLTPEQAAHDKRLNSAVQTTADERAAIDQGRHDRLLHPAR